MIDTRQYRIAPSGAGDFAHTWADKPHRLVYDLATEVEQLQAKLDAIEAILEDTEWGRLVSALGA